MFLSMWPSVRRILATLVEFITPFFEVNFCYISGAGQQLQNVDGNGISIVMKIIAPQHFVSTGGILGTAPGRCFRDSTSLKLEGRPPSVCCWILKLLKTHVLNLRFLVYRTCGKRCVPSLALNLSYPYP